MYYSFFIFSIYQNECTDHIEYTVFWMLVNEALYKPNQTHEKFGTRPSVNTAAQRIVIHTLTQISGQVSQMDVY